MIGIGIDLQSRAVFGGAREAQIPGVLKAGTGRFFLAGEDMAAISAYILNAAAGSATLIGQDVVLTRGRSVVAAAGPFVLAGMDAGLIRTVPGSYTLSAASGSFALVGVPAGFVRVTPGAYTMPSATGTFVMTGVSANLVKATPPSYTGPGDRSTGWASWAGLRAFSAAYAAPGTNPCMDLVDQAGANTYTAKILSSCDLDTAGIATWMSANSVTTAKVSRLYDQSGAGNHFVQATLASMPTYVLNQIGTKPALRFTQAAQQWLATPGSIGTLAEPCCISLVAKNISGGFRIITSDQSLNGIFSGNNPNTWEAYDGANPPFPATSNTPHAAVVLFNGTASTAYCDGTLTSITLTNGKTLSGRVSIGAGPPGNFESDCNVVEVGYNANNLTSVQSALVSDQKTYWGF